jgi:hypothetical protein
LKSLPSRIAMMLDMPLKDIERVLYFEYYIVTEPGLTPLKQHQLLSEDDFARSQDEYGDDSFTAEIGAEAIRGLLMAIDLHKEADRLREELAGTPSEMKQKKARVEDALHATRAAVEEGIVPGGGVALLRCREAVEKARSSAKGDEKIGIDIVLHSLEAPIRQIAENGGIDGAVVADEVADKPLNMGYDANKGEYVDMFKAGIIDPVKVVRVALTNAASIAGLMLTTQALVTNLDKDDAKKHRAEGSVR